MTSDCSCCHEINEWLDAISDCEYPHVFYSKIVIVGLINGKEKGETATRKFPLSYCPQCGRKIDK
jgi:hypothetical protein